LKYVLFDAGPAELADLFIWIPQKNLCL